MNKNNNTKRHIVDVLSDCILIYPIVLTITVIAFPFWTIGKAIKDKFKCDDKKINSKNMIKKDFN
jgi:hypothetical protein